MLELHDAIACSAMRSGSSWRTRMYAESTPCVAGVVRTGAGEAAAAPLRAGLPMPSLRRAFAAEPGRRPPPQLGIKWLQDPDQC
jgi:hypothetical protein